jgi:SAM-dependent methyltransferase
MDNQKLTQHKKELEYEKRSCDVCGNDDLEEVWAWESLAATKSHLYNWKIRNVVCPDCGFLFVSPCPTQNSLLDYYGDSFEAWKGQPVDFSTENRIELLKQNIPQKENLTFVEIGGNSNDEFKSAISGIVDSYSNVEVNMSVTTEFRSIDNMNQGSADILAAYFVLEHVSDSVKFLETCAQVMKEDGILIIEVPNLYFYPHDQAALSWWEHTSHFSPSTLCAVAAKTGLHLKDLSYDLCSRPFGFAAVFTKKQSESNNQPAYDGERGKCEYLVAKSSMLEGLKPILKHAKQLVEVRNRIQEVCSTGEHVVLWAANNTCIDLLNGFELPINAKVVDSNSDKKNYLKPILVHEPEELKDFILTAKLIIINSELYADRISIFIKNELGRTLSNDEVHIIKVKS